jgi:hypothetical protein
MGDWPHLEECLWGSYKLNHIEGETMKEQRWNAIYGACVARQVFDYMSDGNGAPDQVDYERFIEEATSIANSIIELEGDDFEENQIIFVR